MTAPPEPAEEPPALVAGELRGYRRFRWAEDGLRPPVHVAAGPWSGQLEHARCMADDSHAPPARGCACGLYGWYHPSDTGMGPGWGDVTAVIAARGRIVLGDFGFRAASARIEAVVLPRRVGLRPEERRRRERLMSDLYPRVRVYRSRRHMLRAHPPDDLSSLGITVRPNPARHYRRAAVVVWLLGVAALCSVAVVPRAVLLRVEPAAWLLAVAGFVLWQAALMWLASRAAPPPPGTAGGEPRRATG